MSLPSRRQLISGFAGAAMLALPLAANVSTPAYAGDTQVASLQDSVPVKDGRHFGRDQGFIKTVATRASGPGVAVLVFGDKEATFVMAQTAARQAKQQGVPVRFIVRVAGDDSIQVYALAQLHSTLKKPIPGDSQTILNDIRTGWNEAVQIERELQSQRQTASLTPAGG